MLKFENYTQAYSKREQTRKMQIKQPTSIGMWAFKWIVVPIFILVLFSWVYFSDSYTRQCKRLCKEKGYTEWSLYPGRYGARTSCVLSGKILPDGTVDTEAQITIYLDK